MFITAGSSTVSSSALQHHVSTSILISTLYATARLLLSAADHHDSVDRLVQWAYIVSSILSLSLTCSSSWQFHSNRYSTCSLVRSSAAHAAGECILWRGVAIHSSQITLGGLVILFVRFNLPVIIFTEYIITGAHLQLAVSVRRCDNAGTTLAKCKGIKWLTE